MSKANGRRNNVIRICNYYEWSKPMFLDEVINGFRLSLGYSIDNEDDIKQVSMMAAEIKAALNIQVTFRPRRGYGDRAGKFDLIVPASPEAEIPEVYNV